MGHDGHRHHRDAGLQRLHGGGRPAGRLGLLRPGPRRADRQVEEHELVLRLVQLLRLVHRLQPAGHQPGRLPQGRRHAGQGDDRRRAPDQRRLVQRRPELRLDLRVQGGEQPPALLRHQQAHGRRRHAALHGRRPLARRLRPADARRVGRRGHKGTDEGYTTCTFPLKNTGVAAATNPALHPQDADAFLGSDVYRLSASASGTGWTAHLKNALATAKFGETVQVPVYIDKAAGAAATGSVTLNATSESDPSKSMSVNCAFGAGDASAARCRRRSR